MKAHAVGHVGRGCHHPGTESALDAHQRGSASQEDLQPVALCRSSPCPPARNACSREPSSGGAGQDGAAVRGAEAGLTRAGPGRHERDACPPGSARGAGSVVREPLGEGRSGAWPGAVASCCSMRWSRRLWAAVLPLGCFFYVVFYCNSAIWQTLNINTHPLDNIVTGSGFRKLLEERARLLEKPRQPGAQQRLPQCIIIGVRKCGTRALLEFLNLHPNIASAEEEMHFFSADDRYRLGLEWYRKKMPYTLDGQITVEKTPKYFISHVTPARIHRLNSSMKLIVLLRHPTTRVVSDYTQVYFNKMVKNETWDDFEKIAIDPETGDVNTHYKAVQISIYHQFMHRWLSLFPRHQIHIVDGDQLIRDPVAEVVRVEEFLGVEHYVDYRRLYYNTTRGFYCMRVNQTMERCLGASKGRKHPKINPRVLRKLDVFFRPHNERLFKMIRRRFPWT